MHFFPKAGCNIIGHPYNHLLKKDFNVEEHQGGQHLRQLQARNIYHITKIHVQGSILKYKQLLQKLIQVSKGKELTMRQRNHLFTNYTCYNPFENQTVNIEKSPQIVVHDMLDKAFYILEDRKNNVTLGLLFRESKCCNTGHMTFVSITNNSLKI